MTRREYLENQRKYYPRKELPQYLKDKISEMFKEHVTKGE